MNKILKIKFEIIKNYILHSRVFLLSIIIALIIPFVISGLFVKSFEEKVERDALVKYEETFKRNSFKGESFPTVTYPIMRDVVLIGDSYSHFFSYELGFDVTNYSCPGITIGALGFAFEAASDTDKKYAVIFIGPNDYTVNTELQDFHDSMEYYVKLLKEKLNSNIILCEYLPSPYTKATEKDHAHTIEEYNSEILKLIDEKNGIFYLSLEKLRDKDEYIKYVDGKEDFIHFNHKFYIDFLNVLYDKLLYIQEYNIKKED